LKVCCYAMGNAAEQVSRLGWLWAYQNGRRAHADEFAGCRLGPVLLTRFEPRVDHFGQGAALAAPTELGRCGAAYPRSGA
jgi:hypothetical protein